LNSFMLNLKRFYELKRHQNLLAKKGGPTIPPEEKLATGVDLAAPAAPETPPVEQARAPEEAPPAADGGSSRTVDEQKTPEAKPEVSF
jgi:hypothetical protein